MRGVYVADVGDGLCMAIFVMSGEVVQIDCGGKKEESAFNGLRRILNHFFRSDVFILSHFHVDHYNGLLYASVNRHVYYPFRVREVYYPRIPEFREKEKFLRYLFTMNLLVFGSETGLMAYDFLQTISRLNNSMPFWKRQLSKGDLIDVNGSIFEVLWPPAVIDDVKALSDIRRALEDFEKALQEDKETKQLHDYVKDEGIFRVYLEEGGERSEFEQRNYKSTYEKLKRRKLPQVVQDANKSLMKAANHLCLALFEDNRLLFLGDTEKSEIKQIVGDLISRRREKFFIFITPHHGTHWHNSLRRIRCVYSITSNGSKLCPKMKSQFKEISKRSFATFVNSDITIPVYPMRRFWQISPWWFYQ